MSRFGALERTEILAAVLGGLWCGSLFLPWFAGAGQEGDLTGAGVIDSWWLPLVLVAVASGLRVNAGHGLTLENTPPVLALTGLEELNIGHSIISRAVVVGLESAVKDMCDVIRRG